MARGRKPKLTDRTAIEVTLSTDTVTKLKIELFSQAAGCVPRGAVAELVERLLREWLAQRGVQA